MIGRTEVAIIGCGPAGLLSAHAARRAGIFADIYALEAAPSPMARGVYLHGSIPDLSSLIPDAFINFRKEGAAEEYAQKVYGNRDITTSWARFDDGEHPAWALAPVYHKLWARYGPTVRRLRVNATTAEILADEYRLVINTAPAEALCHKQDEHGFERRAIWLEAGAPMEVLPNSVVYNGRKADAWYRASDLFGYRVTEYATPRDGAVQGYKVVGTDCDCHPRILRNGRFGTWTPGILLHQAFQRAEEALAVVL